MYDVMHMYHEANIFILFQVNNLPIFQVPLCHACKLNKIFARIENEMCIDAINFVPYFTIPIHLFFLLNKKKIPFPFLLSICWSSLLYLD